MLLPMEQYVSIKVYSSLPASTLFCWATSLSFSALCFVSTAASSAYASLSAVKLDADLKQYYERKVAEGKNKMSVLNAVRNKLLARILSCVNNKKYYVNKAA